METITSYWRVIEPRSVSGYLMPTRVYFGRGALRYAPELFTQFRRLLVISGHHLQADPAWQQFISQLSSRVNITVYPAIIKRSGFSQVNQLIDFIRSDNFDGVIAAGGGTVIDTAKTAAYLAPATGSLEGYLADQTLPDDFISLPLIAIPTTAGTGSEVTPWAVVWGDDGKKYSVNSSKAFPLMTIVDPSLTDNLPAKETALTGADALTQAVEAYWSNDHNSTSDSYALESIGILMNDLSATVNQPTPELRDKIMWSSLITGLAFSNTQTTLCHAVSYPLTIRWGVPHGQAVAITLPLFLRRIFPLMPSERRAALLFSIGAVDVAEAITKITDLFTTIGIYQYLSDLRVGLLDLKWIAEEALGYNRSTNSLWLPSIDELATELMLIYSPSGQ